MWVAPRGPSPHGRWFFCGPRSDRSPVAESSREPVDLVDPHRVEVAEHGDHDRERDGSLGGGDHQDEDGHQLAAQSPADVAPEGHEVQGGGGEDMGGMDY